MRFSARLISRSALASVSRPVLLLAGLVLLSGCRANRSPVSGMDPIVSITADLTDLHRRKSPTTRPTTTATISPLLDDPVLILECERTLATIGPSLKPMEGLVALVPSFRLNICLQSGRRLSLFGDDHNFVAVNDWECRVAKRDMKVFLRIWEALTGDRVELRE